MAPLLSYSLVIEQRKSRRFDLRLPFELLRSGSTDIRRLFETKNVSSVGVLVECDADLVVGESIEYVITLPTARDADLVSIRCLGKVMRVSGSDLAVTLERYEFVRKARASKAEAPGLGSARDVVGRKNG